MEKYILIIITVMPVLIPGLKMGLELMGNIEINVLNSVKEKERERLRTGTFRLQFPSVQPQRWDAHATLPG